MYFDTHAHYDDEQFAADREALLTRMHDEGVDLILVPGCSMQSSRAAVELSKAFPFVYAAVGVHPHDAQEMEEDSLSQLKALSSLSKVVAIGEIGLDYYYDLSPRDIQKKRFYQQLELARETRLPVIIHEREATRDCLEIITQFPDVPGVFHCYSGSWETAKTILNQGWYLSFTGAITFKNAKRAPEVIQKMPLDRLMIETDSPYLAPVPNRGKRNCSLNLPFIAEKIAQLRNMDPAEVAAVTKENGLRFFGIEAN